MAEKKVLIVNDGGWMTLSAEKGSYDNWVETIQASLSRLLEKNGHSTNTYSMEVVDAKGVQEHLSRRDLGGVTAIIFVTRGMLDEAKRIVARHGRKVRVIVITADPPLEPIILGKTWLSMDMVAEIVR